MRGIWWVLLAGAGVVMASKPTVTVTAAKTAGKVVASGVKAALNVLEPLGIRLNNPGNIEFNAANNWLGEVRPSSNKRYTQFSHPVYGIRALARTLNTYGEKYGLRTVRQVIERWAPEEENDTEAYIADVVQRAGIGPGVDIRANFAGVVAAIIHHENGKQPYDMQLIQEAIAMARTG